MTAKNSEIQIVFNTVDALIKNGQIDASQKTLVGLPLKERLSFNGDQRVQFCSLLRRAGLPLFAVKFLHPHVYPKARSIDQARVDEKIEYSSCLIRLGILSEAKKILASINSEANPEVLIRMGFLFISQWDFESSNNLFNQYIQHPKANSYSLLIAKVNLLQGLVYSENRDQALLLSEKLMVSLESQQAKILLASVYEFRSEVFRQSGHLDLALKEIGKGLNCLENSKSIDYFLLKKQQSLNVAYQTKNIVPLIRLKTLARTRGHFESIRDLDLHIGIISKNLKLLTHLYWSTRSNFFKTRIQRQTLQNNILIETTKRHFGKTRYPILNVNSKILKQASDRVAVNPNHVNLIELLLGETYKPITIFDIFETIYQGEIFIPEYSPDKTHQFIKRFRQDVKVKKLPLTLECKNDVYKLNINGSFSISTESESKPVYYFKAKKYFENRFFKVSEIARLWQCSQITAKRRISILLKENLIIKKGNTQSAQFKLL